MRFVLALATWALLIRFWAVFLWIALDAAAMVGLLDAFDRAFEFVLREVFGWIAPPPPAVRAELLDCRDEAL